MLFCRGFFFSGAKSSNYGKQRLWGSIGWGSVVLLAGFLVDSRNPSNSPIKDYSICHWLSLGIFLMDVVNVLFIRVPRGYAAKEGEEGKEKGEKEETKVVEKVKLMQYVNFPVILFFVVVVLEGMNMALLWNYFFW